MSKQKEKRLYMPSEIYIGKVMYNLELDGYYHTSPEAFVKKTDSDSTVYYTYLNETGYFKEFVKDTPEYLTVDKMFCLTNMMPVEKHNQPISDKVISLYLLKYKLISGIIREEYIPQKSKRKR